MLAGTTVARITTVWLIWLVLNRAWVFQREYAIARRHWHDDTYAAHLCADNNIRARLGRHNTVCDDAHDGLATGYPAYRALLEVARHTYVCGDAPCSTVVRDIILDVTTTVQGFVVALTLMITVPLVVVWTSALAIRGRYQGHGPSTLPLVATPGTRSKWE